MKEQDKYLQNHANSTNTTNNVQTLQLGGNCLETTHESISNSINVAVSTNGKISTTTTNITNTSTTTNLSTNATNTSTTTNLSTKLSDLEHEILRYIVTTGEVHADMIISDLCSMYNRNDVAKQIKILIMSNKINYDRKNNILSPIKTQNKPQTG